MKEVKKDVSPKEKGIVSTDRNGENDTFLMRYSFYPIIHLLPGINEIIFVVTKQLMNVATAMQGMAATVGNPSVCLNTVTHSPSQNICIRYMP